MLTKLETKFAFSLAKGKWRTVIVYYKQLNETGIVAVTMKLEEQMLSNILSGLGSSKHSQELSYPILATQHAAHLVPFSQPLPWSEYAWKR